MSDALDWNLVRSFVAVAERGSLSAAAKELRTSQPTLGRHVAELERQLGVSLFARHARGLALTERGTALYASASAAREAIDGLQRAASGLNESLAGTVRISASVFVAHHVLPSIVAALRVEHPEIAIEIVSSDQVSNLLRRDADVAVRMVKPSQPDLVARRIGHAGLGLFASEGYISAFGEPRVERLPQHVFIGYDRETLALRVLAELGVPLRREDFAVRTDDQPLQLALALEGVGIVALQRRIAERVGGLREVMRAEFGLPDLPVWLVAHREVQYSARVRRVFDHLAAGLKEFYA